MTAEHIRRPRYNRTKFLCCGKQYTNQQQATQHLVLAHALAPTAACQQVEALAMSRRKPGGTP